MSELPELNLPEKFRDQPDTTIPHPRVQEHEETIMTEADRLALSDPDTFQDPERVHRIFTELRQEEPVAWCPEHWGRGFWAITRYDDIQYISKNPQLFSSDVISAASPCQTRMKLTPASKPSRDTIRSGLISTTADAA